jgi:D-3-phosphoglycerate dehydrogenase
MVLAWTRGLALLDRQVRAGHWRPGDAKLRRLSTLTCGIIGFGRIGQATARKLATFGCQLLAHTPHPPADTGPVKMRDLPTLLALSDVVILHAPLTEATRHLIDRDRLASMKAGTLLVNVSRGGLVDTPAVVDALRTGHLGAAALDVLESEPRVPPDLISAGNVMLTPHVAFSSDASLLELRRRAAEEVVRVLRGGPPRNLCNHP